MDAAQSLLEAAPPADLEKNLKDLKALLLGDASCNNPDAVQALERKHPLPFQVIDCNEDGEKPFLTCWYNRVGSSEQYRSPWTNKTHPKSEKQEQSSDDDDDNVNETTHDEMQEEEGEIRVFEATCNDVWDSYKNLYYGHGAVGSVYLKESSDDGVAFEGMFGIQKETTSGSWDSVSFVRVDEPGDKDCNYRVETSLCLILKPSVPNVESPQSSSTRADISLTVSKEVTKACKISQNKLPLNISHIEHMGTLIEANEIELRSNLEKVLIPKNQEILDIIRKKQEPQASRRPQVNPLMGMVMNSDLLKKKLAQQAAAEQAHHT